MNKIFSFSFFLVGAALLRLHQFLMVLDQQQRKKPKPPRAQQQILV